MAITFDHAVKYDGKYYPPNTPIENTPTMAAKAARGGKQADAEGNIEPKAEPPKKGTRGRKKGDA